MSAETKKQSKQPKKKTQKTTKSAPKSTPLTKPQIAKVTINIGVGEAGERLKKAETVLKNITDRKPIQTLSQTTNKDWGIRKYMPIGCKVTLRKDAAESFLKQAFATRDNKIADYAFDEQGNFSFGIPDHTLFKEQKYDPNIGIFGMDISVTMEKPGYRIKHRRINRRHIPHRHRVTPEETMEYVANTFNVEVIT